MTTLFLIHYVATLIMTGAIWLAQLSQYTLLAYVGRRNFIRYEHEHIRRISDIAWFVIYIELFTGLALLFAALTGVSMTVRIMRIRKSKRGFCATAREVIMRSGARAGDDSGHSTRDGRRSGDRRAATL